MNIILPTTIREWCINAACAGLLVTAFSSSALQVLPLGPVRAELTAVEKASCRAAIVQEHTDLVANVRQEFTASKEAILRNCAQVFGFSCTELSTRSDEASAVLYYNPEKRAEWSAILQQVANHKEFTKTLLAEYKADAALLRTRWQQADCTLASQITGGNSTNQNSNIETAVEPKNTTTHTQQQPVIPTATAPTTQPSTTAQEQDYVHTIYIEPGEYGMSTLHIVFTDVGARTAKKIKYGYSASYRTIYSSLLPQYQESDILTLQENTFSKQIDDTRMQNLESILVLDAQGATLQEYSVPYNIAYTQSEPLAEGVPAIQSQYFEYLYVLEYTDEHTKQPVRMLRGSIKAGAYDPSLHLIDDLDRYRTSIIVPLTDFKTGVPFSVQLPANKPGNVALYLVKNLKGNYSLLHRYETALETHSVKSYKRNDPTTQCILMYKLLCNFDDIDYAVRSSVIRTINRLGAKQAHYVFTLNQVPSTLQPVIITKQARVVFPVRVIDNEYHFMNSVNESALEPAAIAYVPTTVTKESILQASSQHDHSADEYVATSIVAFVYLTPLEPVEHDAVVSTPESLDFTSDCKEYYCVDVVDIQPVTDNTYRFSVFIKNALPNSRPTYNTVNTTFFAGVTCTMSSTGETWYFDTLESNTVQTLRLQSFMPTADATNLNCDALLKRTDTHRYVPGGYGEVQDIDTDQYKNSRFTVGWQNAEPNALQIQKILETREVKEAAALRKQQPLEQE